MVDPHDPSATPPPPPPPPFSAPPPPSAPPPKKGMSTGVKVAIGCGILLVLVIVGFVVLGVIGGNMVKNRAEDLTGGLEAQQEASEKIQALEQEHPFTAPADGVVTDELAGKFLAVTDDAWEGMREDMEEIGERSRDIEERGGEAGIGDAMAGVQALGRARVALAEALEENDMPVSAYLWTGMELTRAYQALDVPPDQSGVPARNLEIAQQHREALAEIADSGDENEPGKGMVLGMAWTLGTGEGVTPNGWNPGAP